MPTNACIEPDAAHAIEAIERAILVWNNCETTASEAYAIIDIAVSAYIAAREREKQP